MDGMADVSSRISQISAQLAALSTGTSPAKSTSGTSPATGTTGAAGTAGSSTTADGAGSSSPFGSVLADAMNNQLSTIAAATDDTTLDSATSALGSSAPGSSTPGATTDPSASAALVAARMALTGLPTASSATPAASTASSATPGASAAAPATAAAPKPAASYPTDLSSYGNGRIPASALKPLGVGDHRLWAPAADKFRAMRSAAARDGVSIGVNDSYRSYAEQVDMARRKGLYSQGGLAAAPGTSEHGLGKSVDLQLNSRALTWMRAHADEYGFRNNVPRESWHWTYSGK